MNSYKKIKKYNQYLLAISGTLAFIFFTFIGGLYITQELRYMFNDYQYQEGILSNEETNELLVDSLRKQIISFDNFHLIDSTNKIYVLPVSQANLEKEESIGDLSGMLNAYNGYASYYNDDRYYDDLNNLVLYDGKKEESEIIFNERISINEYIILGEDGDKFIAIKGTKSDSNKDRYLTGKDLQQLYIYDSKSRNLNLIKSKENYTTLHVYEDLKTRDVIGKLGLDRNGNGVFEPYKEPIIFYKIDLDKKVFVKIIQEPQLAKLQELLEGR